jgi:uncharacterized membrane protein
MSKTNFFLLGLLGLSILAIVHLYTLSLKKCPEYEIISVDDEILLIKK